MTDAPHTDLHDRPRTDPPESTAGHEPVTVSAKLLVFSAAGLTLLVIVSLAAMWGYQQWLGSGSRPFEGAEPEQRRTKPPPHTPLDPDQPQHRRRYERKQRKLLQQYEWLDENQKTARIPIDRAMELVERRYQSRVKKEKKRSSQ